MNAKEARELAEVVKITPEIVNTIEEIKEAATVGKFSIYKDILSHPTRVHLERLGYKVRWHDVQRDGYWEVSW
jgi:hypothetical protein